MRVPSWNVSAPEQKVGDVATKVLVAHKPNSSMNSRKMGPKESSCTGFADPKESDAGPKALCPLVSMAGIGKHLPGMLLYKRRSQLYNLITIQMRL